MGNCIETYCKNNPGREMMMMKNQQQEEEEEEENPKNGSMMRVKVVLTKEELEWLMSQLKSTEGTRRLEDVLGDIKRSREKISSSTTSVAWKPSLDSIVESPEVPEGMDRS